MALSWHLVMPACSSCRLCRNESQTADGMTILELLKSKLLSDVSSPLISQYLLVIMGTCVCVLCQTIPFCVCLCTVDNTGWVSVSFCTGDSHVSLKVAWSTYRFRRILFLFLTLESQDRVSGSYISVSGLYLIMALYYCKCKNSLWKWGLHQLASWGWSSL